MPHFRHVRHKPPTELARPRELVVACPQMQSKVNLSRIVRAAGCCGVQRVIAAGHAKVDREIARDALATLELDVHRSLPPVLTRLKQDGYSLVGLEQTDQSENLHQFSFPRRAVLVLGHERHGITDDVLSLLDHAVEIPVYGRPLSYNVATAASMALYEYCRQFPDG